MGEAHEREESPMSTIIPVGGLALARTPQNGGTATGPVMLMLALRFDDGDIPEALVINPEGRLEWVWVNDDVRVSPVMMTTGAGGSRLTIPS